MLARSSQPSPGGHGTRLHRLPRRGDSQLAKVSIWQGSRYSRWLVGPDSAAQPSCPRGCSEVAQCPLRCGWNHRVELRRWRGCSPRLGYMWFIVGQGVCCFLRGHTGTMSDGYSRVITGRGKNWGPKNRPQTSDHGETGAELREGLQVLRARWTWTTQPRSW